MARSAHGFLPDLDGLAEDFETLREAIKDLFIAELVFVTEDEKVLPTPAARHFDWLELS